MPIPSLPSLPSNSSVVPDLQLLEALREEFHFELSKVVARLNAVEDQLKAGTDIKPEKTLGEPAESNEPENNLGENNLGEVALVAESPKKEAEVSKKSIFEKSWCEEAAVVGLVHFSESAWTYPVVIGLVDVGLWDVIFSILLMLLNLGMQAGFSYIILGEGFMGSEFALQLDFARRWRSSFAHDHKYLDLTSRSLVSRVCWGDGSLILATSQATLVDQINSYLTLDYDQFELGYFQDGKLLCMLCILLWALCVYKEFRNIWLTLECLFHLPRTCRTKLRNNILQSLSKGRFKLLVVNCITRFTIAAVLLYAGVQWLARTTSITELMLNCVALNAILDVDEFLFEGFTPLSVHLAIQRLEPMTVKHTRRRSQLESLALFLVLVATIIVPYCALLEPLGQTMLEVKSILCDGNQQFVVGLNSNTGCWL
ncbi:unnamed protein product [Durusdinium trenchii]|uniref:Uncharacterized protein n=1 Tax=Durusdinium trenchii TaxID=1381693 RepID=A0ABP0LPZ6_9DINO